MLDCLLPRGRPAGNDHGEELLPLGPLAQREREIDQTPADGGGLHGQPVAQRLEYLHAAARVAIEVNARAVVSRERVPESIKRLEVVHVVAAELVAPVAAVGAAVLG